MAEATTTTEADVIELHDKLDTKARQLRAMLHRTYGQAGDDFRTSSYELQDDYLWACADIADEIWQGLRELGERLQEARK